MFPLPWPIVIFFLAIYLAIALTIYLIYAFLLNLVFRRTLYRYLFSSALIGLAAYIVTTVVGLEALPPLRWLNTVPQDLRTTLWDHLHLISCFAGVIAITLWQVIVRVRRKLIAPLPT
jgi:hypothetical protein